jgi:hypothetical protein
VGAVLPKPPLFLDSPIRISSPVREKLHKMRASAIKSDECQLYSLGKPITILIQEVNKSDDENHCEYFTLW